MKKAVKALLVTLLLIMTLSLTACGDSYGLVGRWNAYTDSESATLEFSRNGSGVGISVWDDIKITENFNWSTNGEFLTLIFGDNDATTVRYSISEDGNTLNIRDASFNRVD